MEKTEQMENVNVASDSGKAVLGAADEELVISLKTPIRFERELYEKIDLSGLHDIKAADMVAINRRLTRSGNVDSTPEISLEYALYMAHMVTDIPLEFFDQLPPSVALAVRGRVTGFLFRQE